jgi:hypothetical protein
MSSTCGVEQLPACQKAVEPVRRVHPDGAGGEVTAPELRQKTNFLDYA